MPPRERETDTIRKLREKMDGIFAVAETALAFSDTFFGTSEPTSTPTSDELLAVFFGLHRKIMADLWAAIVLAERGLPAASLVREILEAFISVAYVAKEDSEARARLYLDSLVVREIKRDEALRRALSDLDSLHLMDVVFTPDRLESWMRAEQDLVKRYGKAGVEAMKRCLHWTGKSVKETAERAGLPSYEYDLEYSQLSDSVHSRDVDHVVNRWLGGSALFLEDHETTRALLHDVKWTLFSATAYALRAMELIATKLGWKGRVQETRKLQSEIDAWA